MLSIRGTALIQVLHLMWLLLLAASRVLPRPHLAAILRILLLLLYLPLVLQYLRAIIAESVAAIGRCVLLAQLREWVLMHLLLI